MKRLHLVSGLVAAILVAACGSTGGGGTSTNSYAGKTIKLGAILSSDGILTASRKAQWLKQLNARDNRSVTQLQKVSSQLRTQEATLRADEQSQAAAAQQLQAQGLPASSSDRIVDGFRQCFHDRASSSDPTANPPSCVAAQNDRPPIVAPGQPPPSRERQGQIGLAIRDIALSNLGDARAQDFTDSIQRSLLYNAAAFGVSFLLIFFLQGPYGQDPLRAGLMLIPFGAAFMLIGPFSGRLSDRIGSRILAPIGLGISALALFALTTIDQHTPFWLLAIFMAVMGGGSGFFVSPNTNAIMSSVEPHTRGAAAGILNMLNNTGQMLSIAIVFPLALSKLPFGAVQQVFITGGGMGSFASIIPVFLSGLHEAFLISFVLSVIAAIVAALRPSHGTQLLGDEAA